MRPIRTADDLKGLKIRSMEIPAYTTMLESMGAVATPIAWAELYTSLQTGVVDGQENPPANVLNGSLQEVQKYYTLDQHSISSLVLMMNEDFYQSLPADLQQVVDEEDAWHRSPCEVQTVQMKSWLCRRCRIPIWKYTFPRLKKRETFKEAAQEPVLEWLRGEIGSEYADEFMAAVEGVKKGEGILTSEEKVMEQQQTGSGTQGNTIVVGACIVAVFSVLFGIFTVVRTKRKGEADEK